MLTMSDIIDYYDADPQVSKLKDLDNIIRELHRSSAFKQSLALIREGDNMQNGQGSSADGHNPNLESDLVRLKQGLDTEIRSHTIRPGIYQRFYAEYDSERGVIRMLLPFKFDGMLDGFSLIGLPKWYANTNRQITPDLSERQYTLFEIHNIPNLTAADRVLRNMSNPPEFEMLGIHLSPTLTIIYNNDHQTEGPQDIVLPEDMHPIKRERFYAIIRHVDDYWDDQGIGVLPNIIERMMEEEGNQIPKHKVSTFMREMVEMGYLKRSGVAGTQSVRYYPLRAVINSNDNKEPQNIVLPEDMNSIKRERYSAIIRLVGNFHYNRGQGVQPSTISEMLEEEGIQMPDKRTGSIMKEMVNDGYLQRKGKPGTINVRYYPISAVIQR